MRKQNVIEIQSVVESFIILYEYREIVNCQTIARNSRTRFASWERCDGRFSNRPWKNDFYRVLIFVLARQELSLRTSIIVISLSVIDDQISVLSLNFTAMELLSDVLCPFLAWGLWSGNEMFVIGIRHFNLFESTETSITACFSLWQVPFWNPSRLETLKRFCMEMFKFSEFDLEWTTTKSTIKIYTSLDSSLDRILRLIALHRHRGNTALDSFVLFWLYRLC